MTSFCNDSLGVWASISLRQLDAPVDNESIYDQFEMSTLTGSGIDRDAAEHSHGTDDIASVPSGTTSLLRRNNGEKIAENRTLTLSLRRLYSKWQKLCGYQFGVCFCAGLSGTVFLINSILTLWASKSFGVNAGAGTIQHGDCHQTKNLSLWLHLAINVLSTALLSASNYTMQCLSSPTRQDIDKAHAQNNWLDIGVPSVRNLRRITWKRIILWWLLAITSLPLHLLYNSAIFDSLSTHEYDVYVVSREFLSGAPFSYKWTHTRLHSFRNPNSDMKLKKLSARECIEAYQNPFTISKYQDVLVVSPWSNATNSLLGLYPSSYTNRGAQWGYECIGNEDECRSHQAATGTGIAIEYCLVQEVNEDCMLQFSLPIMLIVMTCNLIKTVSMVLVFLGDGSRPLMTVGDAIASFLNEPDPATKNICLADKYFFRKNPWQERTLSWKSKRHRWFRAASITRWLACYVLCTITIITTGVLLRIGLENLHLRNPSISQLWKLGFGAVTNESLINLSFHGRQAGVMTAILLTNAPQVILSFLYFTFNGLFSSMLLMQEWSGFAHERKTLRVSWPTGKQRSTFWLQIPYKYGIPLLVMSASMHWFVSQSLFLARVNVVDQAGEIDPFESISTCGYSAIAIISVIALGSIILLLGILAGSIKYKAGMPFVGSCSAAISAGCHALRDDSNASLLPLMWGAVETEEGSVKHCCFSSRDVSPPIEGEVYAGAEEMMNSDPMRDITKQLVPRVTRRRDKPLKSGQK